MNDTLRNKSNKFVQNYYELKKNYKWSNSISTRLGALLYAMDNQTVDVDAISRCRRLVNDNTGSLSKFRDTANYLASNVLLALQSSPEDTFKKALDVYHALKKEGFHSSPYLVLAAISIAIKADLRDYGQIVKTARNYYNLMKEKHRFITSSDDYCFCVLLAIEDKPVTIAIQEMEEYYEQLKDTFNHSNAMQSLSHVLSLSNGDIAYNCKRVEEFYHALKNRKCKFGLGIELSFLGIIALLEDNIEKLADEIAEVDKYLNSKKGFGIWSITDKERIMYSIAIVCGNYLKPEDKNTMNLILANDIINILRAQQVTAITAAT